MAANVISGALGRLKVPVVLLEVIGLAVVAGLAGLWLQIPDSHAWEFGASVVSGIGILLGFLWLHTTMVRRLRGDVSGSGWAGMGLLAVWLLLWRMLAAQVSLLSVHAEQRAGFWNSRLSAQQRVIFTEPKLLAWQMDAISTLLWFVLPSIFLPLVMETVARGVRGLPEEAGPFRTVVRVYGRWQMWLTAGVASLVATSLVEKLTAWQLAETVRGELVSAALRLGGLYLLLVALGLGVLAVVAELLARAASAGTPRESQERTVSNP